MIRQFDLKRVVIVGSDKTVVDRARSLGCEVFLVQHPMKVDSSLVAGLPTTLLIDYDRDERLVSIMQAAHAITPFSCAVSLTEHGLEPAARLNEALGLRGLPVGVVRRTRDKLTMRAMTCDLSPIASQEIKSRGDAIRFMSEHKTPFILKPSEGVGSKGVALIEVERDFEGIEWGSGTWIAEEYLEGRLFSVEAFTYRGTHHIFAVNEEILTRSVPGFVHANPYLEAAHQLPADLASDAVTKIGDLVKSVLDRLCITDGPTHTEVILTKDGPRLVETHTRLGGGFIPEMIQALTGIDLCALAIAWPCGMAEAIEPIHFTQGAAVQYLSASPGRVKYVSGEEIWKRMPGVLEVEVKVKPGDLVKPLRSSEDRLGHVMAIGRTSTVALELCREAANSIKIVTE